jgi:hypothetical protein
MVGAVSTHNSKARHSDHKHALAKQPTARLPTKNNMGRPKAEPALPIWEMSWRDPSLLLGVTRDFAMRLRSRTCRAASATLYHHMSRA